MIKNKAIEVNTFELTLIKVNGKQHFFFPTKTKRSEHKSNYN